jgi:hypothetical protein
MQSTASSLPTENLKIVYHTYKSPRVLAMIRKSKIQGSSSGTYRQQPNVTELGIEAIAFARALD